QPPAGGNRFQASAGSGPSVKTNIFARSSDAAARVQSSSDSSFSICHHGCEVPRFSRPPPIAVLRFRRVHRVPRNNCHAALLVSPRHGQTRGFGAVEDLARVIAAPAEPRWVSSVAAAFVAAVGVLAAALLLVGVPLL